MKGISLGIKDCQLTCRIREHRVTLPGASAGLSPEGDEYVAGVRKREGKRSVLLMEWTYVGNCGRLSSKGKVLGRGVISPSENCPPGGQGPAVRKRLSSFPMAETREKARLKAYETHRGSSALKKKKTPHVDGRQSWCSRGERVPHHEGGV